MSVKTWKEEFYDDGVTGGAIRTPLQAVRASLMKWQGLTKENLEKHGLEMDRGDIGPPHTPMTGATSCVLCVLYWSPKCERCPLVSVSTRCPDSGSVYRQVKASGYKNVTPMIELLEKVEKFVEKRDGRE